MKLYTENKELYFDYSEVNMSAPLDRAESQCRHYLMETNCEWLETNKPQIVKMEFTPSEWRTEYGNARHYESLLKDCFYKAKAFPLIEITPEVEELLIKTAKRSQELYEAEVKKEQEFKRKAEWERKCENGCGSCPNKKRCGDDYFCAVSGDILPEKSTPQSYGKIVYLFNNEAFPTENCTYNVNKMQEAI